MEKSKKFQSAKYNVELEIVKDNINLLQQYAKATDDKTRADIHKQMHALVQGLLKKGYSPNDLIERLNKAIKLNEYRPKNQSLFLLAKSDDLDYIGGEYDTFNPSLSKLAKDINKNEDAIRDSFDHLTVNRFDLVKQFTKDWIRRLDQHKDLIEKVRKAPDQEKMEVYEELLKALAKDFCKEYDIPEDMVRIRVVENWAKAGIKKTDKTLASTDDAWNIVLPPDTPQEKRDKLISEIAKDPYNHPEAKKLKIVSMNFELMQKDAQKNNIDLFVYIMESFAHEMGHVLDILKPREGALGPQVQMIDKKTYTDINADKKRYYQSATELSSYEISLQMMNELKNYWRD